MFEVAEMPRQGETDKPPHRSKRVFKLHEDWFFSTREGLNPGPYENEEQAEQAAGEFVEFAMVSSAQMVMQLLNSLTKSGSIHS